MARPGAVALGVAVLCWIQPLWDQFAASGNLGRALGQSGGSDRSVGVAHGLRLLAETVFVPPFFVPGSMGDMLRRGERPTTATAVVTLVLWAAGLVAVWLAARRRQSPIGALAAIAVVALVSSCYAAIKIPPTEQFGIIGQNYYWAWPVGVFAATALLAPLVRLGLRRSSPRTARIAVAASAIVVAVASLPLLRPTNQLPETDHEWAVSREQARPLLDQLDRALDGRQFDTPVLVELGTTRHVRYTMLAELQRHGVDFRFGAGSTDLSRFGRDRCDDGSAAWYLVLRSGRGAVRIDVPGTLLASVAGLQPAESERNEELAALFGEAIRDETVDVDLDLVAHGPERILFGQVLGAPGVSARGLSQAIVDYNRFGVVAVPDDLRDELEEWHRMETAADADRMAIYLQRISGERGNLCDDVAPGDAFLAG
jgi:hypothetical protein